MNSREKVLNALNHKTGPVPLDIGGTATSGIHISTMEALRDYYGLEKRVPKVLDPFQMLGMVEDDLREAIGIDTTPLCGLYNMFGFKNEKWKQWTAPWGQKMLVPEMFNTTEDSKYKYIYAEGDLSYPPAGKIPKSGYFFDSIIRQKPFDDDELNYEDNLQEYKLLSEDEIKYYENIKEKFDDSKYAVTANFGGTALGDIALVVGPGIKDPRGIRDVEEWYISTYTRKNYLHKIFEKQTEIALKNLEKIYSIVGDNVNTVFICGADFGTQKGLFSSPDTFRELYAPYYKLINNWIHKNTKWKTFKHSCGGIDPIIKDLIDCGFDILNPVQWTASGMEMKHLKKEYGDNIVFWGGGVDTQKTFPFGTPDEVKKEVLKTCTVFAESGGFIFNTIHNIQACVPVENVVAMIEALNEFNKGR